ncbi:hypothetical protein DFS34DRAFT_604677 [Phlyctochytrium arcticum]|nr:hypothetical protein DFS34DRAFT_604677 [Phlyctochytrium arcticum]
MPLSQSLSSRAPRILPRLFHASQVRNQSTILPAGTSTYPYPLHVHAPTNSLSFLSSQDLKDRALVSKQIIGWVTKEVPSVDKLGPASFKANREFEELIQEVLAEWVTHDEGFQGLAQHQKVGFLNINDQRTPSPWGRVSDPEDILGTIQLDNGKLVSGSYEGMPTHRLVSGNGLFQLSELLHGKLLDKLRSLAS